MKIILYILKAITILIFSALVVIISIVPQFSLTPLVFKSFSNDAFYALIKICLLLIVGAFLISVCFIFYMFFMFLADHKFNPRLTFWLSFRDYVIPDKELEQKEIVRKKDMMEYSRNWFMYIFIITPFLCMISGDTKTLFCLLIALFVFFIVNLFRYIFSLIKFKNKNYNNKS